MSNIEKQSKINGLRSQFQQRIIKWPHQFERKVAKVLELPKGYSQEQFRERLGLVFPFEPRAKKCKQ